ALPGRPVDEHEAGPALRDKTANAGGTARGQQVVRPFRPQACVPCERLLEVAHAAQVGKLGELVHDNVRLGLTDGTTDRSGVECISNDRCGAELLEHRPLQRCTGHADDVVALLYEQRDEAASENAGRARDEDPLRLHLCYASGSWKRPVGAAGTAPASGKLTKLRRAV